MRQRVIYILKHNAVIQRLYRVIMSYIIRMCGRFIPIDDNIVIFVSFMGRGFNDSPKAIYEYMQSHPQYKKYRCIWAFEEPEKFPDLETVKIDTPAYFKTALKAKYWITNTNIERGLSFKKKGQLYLNTWHGIALKYIGNDCPGRKDYDFNTVNYLTVCGEHDQEVYKSAFNADEKCFLRCGLPRNEKLWNITDEQRKIYRDKLGIPEEKKVILYAPTWRESTNGGKSYDIKPPIHFEQWENELANEYIVLFRAHHLTTKILGVKFNEFVRDVSNYSEVNDLMIASDILITDYSAIAFDYSILCRPLLVYAYDYDTYLVERGTYFEMDEKYPNKVCKTEKELFKRIRDLNYIEECKRTEIFRNNFNMYGIDATRVSVEALFSE